MGKKLKVGILAGGPSAEHEVSLATGANVLKFIDTSKYQPAFIKISKNGQWFLAGKAEPWQKVLKGCDVIFNALHGTFGEDGKVQAFLEHAGVKYTGSGIAASALAMDKLRAREIFKLAGFHVPKTLKIKRGENYQARLNFFITKLTKMPVVVKPCCNGSSVGVSIVHDISKLPKAIEAVFQFNNKALVEEYIRGRELTCGVLENSKDQSISALPVTEIVPLKKHKFFNYDAKYKAGHSQEVTPADIDSAISREAQQIAVRAHQLLGCSGYSRTDMIVKNGRTVYVLEINTLPGLTETSLIPQAAKAAGLTLTELLDRLLESSLV